MSVNKIVFIILWAIIVLLIIMLVIQLNRGTTQNQPRIQRWDFNIWILKEDKSEFENIIRDFKSAFPRYSNTRIHVESFDDRWTYETTIMSAIWSWVAPDIFMLNNTEYSPLMNHIIGIDSGVVSVNDFRRDFHPVFSDDLIFHAESLNIDALLWIPVWYQVPALFYNRRNFPRSSELLDWSRFNMEMLSVAERWEIIPLAIWDGTSVTRINSIVQSFLAHEWVTDLDNVQNPHTRQALNQYKSLWLIGSRNYIDLVSSQSIRKTDIEHFTNGDVASMIGYPRDLLKISDIWYQSNMFFVTPFPFSEWKDNAVAIDYDYFVIQRNTWNPDLAEDFLSYLASERGQRKFIEHFPHNIPARSWFAIEIEEQRVHPGFNVIYKNFISDQNELISFNIHNKQMFSRGIRSILEEENWFSLWFQILKSNILCSVKKYRDFENLSTPCR